MTPVLAALAAFAVYALGYGLYGRFLAHRVFRLDPEAVTPAHALADGVDYVPTRPQILFGHHYASITGLAPMLGPAVAVIWGWLPALLWVVLGAVLVGAVHDFAALVVSLRAKGLSVGKVAEGVIGKRARTLFLLVILFGVALAMGVFVFVIARLFSVELAPKPMPPRRHLWVRAAGPLPDDPALHRYLLAYASDFNFLVTSLLPHGVSWLTPGMQVASLDHAMWFHRPFRMDDWLLYAVHSPTASGARGLVEGRLFTRDGRLVATVVQEGLIRRRA